MSTLIVHVSRSATGSTHHNTLVLNSEVTICFHYLLDRPDTKDDTVTLMTDDNDGRAYRCTYALHDTTHVEEIEDNYLRVTFRQIKPNRSYSIKIDPGKGPSGKEQSPYFICRHIILPVTESIPTIRGGIDYTGGGEIADDYVLEEQTPLTQEQQMLLYQACIPLAHGEVTTEG